MVTRVLFVDDDVLTQWVMTEVLVRAGCAVTSACRGEQALSLLDDKEYDLLLTELDLPDGIGGLQLAEAFQAAHPDRPVIYTSSVSLSVGGQLNASEAFVAKPFNACHLLRLVDSLVGGRWAAAPGRHPPRRSELFH